MARPPNLASLPRHPSIDWTHIEARQIGGHTGPAARVRCPICRKHRWIAVRTLRHQAAHENYSGACRPCWRSQPKARAFRTSRNPTGRRLSTNGYVVLGKNAVPDEQLALFDAMRSKASSVFEHRWVMALHLGRPLRSEELVDHMNGNKTDNRVENLRLYVRGMQQPGSAPGYGTYYHEWQLAKARVMELERLLGVAAG